MPLLQRGARELLRRFLIHQFFPCFPLDAHRRVLILYFRLPLFNIAFGYEFFDPGNFNLRLFCFNIPIWNVIFFLPSFPPSFPF